MRDKKPSQVAASALAELTLWANYPGHLLTDTHPPEVEPKRIAYLVRVVMAEYNRFADQLTDMVRLAEENKALEADCRAYQKEHERLRSEISRLTRAEYDELGLYSQAETSS